VQIVRAGPSIRHEGILRVPAILHSIAAIGEQLPGIGGISAGRGPAGRLKIDVRLEGK
jgi:hypothetical protein